MTSFSITVISRKNAPEKRELMITADASVLQSDFFKQAGFSHGSRDKRDLAYHRPLALESPAPEHW